MLTIHTVNDTQIECDLILRSIQYNALSIYTHAITPIQAYQIFDNPEETAVLTVTEKGKPTNLYRGFTDVFSVQKNRMLAHEDGILIILMHPQPDDDEEVIPNAE